LAQGPILAYQADLVQNKTACAAEHQKSDPEWKSDDLRSRKMLTLVQLTDLDVRTGQYNTNRTSRA